MKKIVLKCMNFSYFFICGWMMFSINAQAYIDPSAVTYIIQAVAAVLIALGAVLTVFRHKVMAFLKKNSKKSAKREIHLKDDSIADGKNSERQRGY